MNHRNVLIVHITSPDKREGAFEGRPISVPPTEKRIYPRTSSIGMNLSIEEEWYTEAGNILVVGEQHSMAYDSDLNFYNMG
jgi:hypothetical protein